MFEPVPAGVLVDADCRWRWARGRVAGGVCHIHSLIGVDADQAAVAEATERTERFRGPGAEVVESPLSTTWRP